MRTLIHEHILNIKNEEGNIIETTKNNTYVIYPDPGKLLRNKRTGFVIESLMGIDSKDDSNEYEEIDKE